MKKILFALSLFFAVTSITVAQEKSIVGLSKSTERKLSPDVLAKKEVATLAEFVGLNDTQVTELYKVFVQKYQILNDTNYSQERKNVVISNSDSKVKAVLTEEQNKKFETRKEEFNKIISSLTKSK